MPKEEEFELSPVVKKLSENAKKELLRAFKGTTKNAKTIKEVWDDIVFMWAQSHADNTACTYAGISVDTLYEWEKKYTEWVTKENSDHHPDENPIKTMKGAIQVIEEEKAAKKTPMSAQHFSDVLRRRRERDFGRHIEKRNPGRPSGEPESEEEENEPEVELTPKGYKKNKPYTRRGKYDIDLEGLKASPADLNRIANNFKPASLKSGTLVKQARAIREEEEKLDTEK